MRSVVVLPEPEGPSSTKNSPGSIVEVDAVQHGRRAVALDDAFEADAAGCARFVPLIAALRP